MGGVKRATNHNWSRMDIISKTTQPDEIKGYFPDVERGVSHTGV